MEPVRIIIPIPTYGFDPTEAAIPWKILSVKGHEVLFATPRGTPGVADSIMLTGKGLGVWRGVLAARSDAVAAYRELERDGAFQKPLSYSELRVEDFDGIFLPGGHDKGVREYLESETLQSLVADFITAGKAVGAVCHGVLLAARSIDPARRRSPLAGATVTSLLRSQELLAWRLTRLWLGDYYLTYPGRTVEDEVRSALTAGGRFVRGPLPLLKDDLRRPNRGLGVRHGNLVTASWPGDAYNLSLAFDALFHEVG